jgi:hypothetical protein
VLRNGKQETGDRYGFFANDGNDIRQLFGKSTFYSDNNILQTNCFSIT